jgi:hypothetical protein
MRMIAPESVVIDSQKCAGESAGYRTTSVSKRSSSTRFPNRSRTASGSPQRNGGGDGSGWGGRYSSIVFIIAAIPLSGVHEV